jgi:signal transduction histidine kinase
MSATGTAPVQRIVKVRRDYNRWVADETLEDYALRFTPRSFRRWSAFRVANTAFGAVSFLALEAIGAAIALSYGFVNAMWAIGVVSLVIFVTGLPIAWRAARQGLDMDLLARGAGFGYLGSTITSLIYAGFTFIFFALEAAIMAQAFELWFDLPRPIGYVVSALVVLPLVTHGVTLISRLQVWTQPLWLALLVLPFVAVAVKNPQAFADFASLNGRLVEGDGFSWAAFGAAATVAAALIAQIGEQVDFLRFMPEPQPGRRWRWWAAVIVAGPGWIVLGAAKMVGGAFLAHLVLQEMVAPATAIEPTRMYLAGFEQAVGPGAAAVLLTGVFVIVSQLKINVTNAYAGSLAWSNVFARLTHSHPGRVVWLVFNVLIALTLMLMGVFEALERVLALYSHLAVAWIAALFADLAICKPLGLSPARIEFRRAYLYDVNPAGFGGMAVGSALGVATYAGLFGEAAQPASAAVALLAPLAVVPTIAWATRGRYAIARPPVDFGARHVTLRCSICRNRLETDDMAHCPAYGGAICSLCCTLDARCGDRCKPPAGIAAVAARALERALPNAVAPGGGRRVLRYGAVFGGLLLTFGAVLWLLAEQQAIVAAAQPAWGSESRRLLLSVFAALALLAAVAAWWLVLAHESREVAQQESERQNQLLQKEIDAHRRTDAALQSARERADAANLAKSRFLTGMSHEMRAPLTSILGYARLLAERRPAAAERRAAVQTIRRSGEHLASLVDGLLELSRIEAGKLRLAPAPLALRPFIDEIVAMFAPLVRERGLDFDLRIDPQLPPWVRADALRLRQILINLLSNALKFTARGRIGLTVHYQREVATVEVADTGCGIAEADRERIFLPFERGAGPPAVAGSQGVGLGLTIVRLLAELMGGSVAVDSTPGAGSRFRVRLYLPSLRAGLEDAPERVVVGYDGPRRRLLVVDDEADHRALLAATLAPLGFAVTQVDGVAQCLAAVRDSPPDAVLLDINLADGSGWQAVAALRAAGLADLPIVMVSANIEESARAGQPAAAVQGFVGKPLQPAELYEVLGRALGLHWRHAPGGPAAPPSSEVLRELLALSAGGYPRALRARLEELRHAAPRHAAWIDHLLALLDSAPEQANERLAQQLIDARQPRAAA